MEHASETLLEQTVNWPVLRVFFCNRKFGGEVIRLFYHEGYQMAQIKYIGEGETAVFRKGTIFPKD